jgi:hypothetical protein
VPAGDAKEVVAWPERLVAAAVLSSVGEAPWSCAADPRPWLCSQLLEAVRCANKSPPVAVTAEPDRDLEGAEVVEQGAGFDGARWRSSGTSFVDFPAAGELLPIQGSRGGVAAARWRYVFVVVLGSGIHRDFFVIFSLLWTFLYEPCSKYQLIFAKKRYTWYAFFRNIQAQTLSYTCIHSHLSKRLSPKYLIRRVFRLSKSP